MKSPQASQCLLLALITCTFVRTQAFAARCVGVTDGDTITVLVGPDEMKIRLEGIDAPEKG